MKNKLEKVRFKVTGLNLDKLYSKMLNSGIKILSIKKPDYRTAIICLYKDDYNELLKFDMISAYAISLIESRDFLYFLKKACNYLGMVVGICCSLFISISCANIVTSVEIIGAANHSCENRDKCIFLSPNMAELNDYISALGVVEGAAVSSIKPTEIERQICAKFDNIANAVVKRQGMKVQISIHEASLPNSSISSSSLDIISPECAIITNMVVSQGQPMVKAGDKVVKGQVIVKGENGKRALASVTAKLYYHVSSVYAENSIELTQTGNYKEYSYLDICGLKFGNVPKDFGYAFYEITESEVLVSNNLFLPIKKVTLCVYELVSGEVKRPLDDAIDNIKKQLVSQAEEQAGIVKGDTYQTYFIVTNTASGLYLLDCYLEVIRILK